MSILASKPSDNKSKDTDKKDTKETAAKGDSKQTQGSTGEARNGEKEGITGNIWKNIKFLPKSFLGMAKDAEGESLNPDEMYEKLRKKSTNAKASTVKANVNTSVPINELAAKKDRMYGTDHNTIASIATPQSLYGIGGMPAVFLNNTDPPSPLNPQGLGKYYIEQNIVNGQFVVFRPGFLEWSIGVNQITNLVGGDVTVIGDILGKLVTGSLTDLTMALDDYWFDVERTCRLAIYMMGVEDVYFPFQLGGENISKAVKWQDKLGNQGGGSIGVTYSRFGTMTRKHWRSIGLKLANVVGNKSRGIADFSVKDTANSRDTDGLQDMGIVVFYINGNVEQSESYSNTTSNNPLNEAIQAVAGSGDEAVKQMIGMIGWGGRGSIANSELGFFVGQPLMPMVWGESTADKSYSFSIRCVSSSGDPVSVFMNVIYPVIKIMHLAIPLGVGGYITAPPVVSVFSMGSMNIKYGMITSLNIQKNMETLTSTGYATEVDIAVQVTDLNPHVYKERPGWFRNSIYLGSGLTNNIATLLGMNITTLPNSKIKKFQKDLREIDEKFNGSAFVENAIYGIQNMASRFARSWENGSAEVSGRILSVTGKIRGIWSGVSNSVPKGALADPNYNSTPRAGGSGMAAGQFGNNYGNITPGRGNR